MRAYITCKMTIRIIRCICKLYLGVIVVVLWWTTLVLYDLELNCLAEFFNIKRNTLQNCKQDPRGSKPDAIGLLGQMQR
jgi:hypothetical protein